MDYLVRILAILLITEADWTKPVTAHLVSKVLCNELSLLIILYAKLSMTTSARNSTVQKDYSHKN